MAEPTPALAAELVIDDVEQLKVLSDTFRLQLIDLLSDAAERGATAKEMAEALGTKQTKLYRHLALLEEHGLVRVVETRVVSGILEKRYGVTARSFRVDRSLLAGAGGEPALASVLDGIFEKARAEIMEGVRAGLIDVSRPEAERSRMALSASHARLSPRSVRTVMRQVEKLAAIDAVEDPGGAEYGLVVAFYPRAPRHAKEPNR
jgi:DNA-binding transcriptional ArsR family regulator